MIRSEAARLGFDPEVRRTNTITEIVLRRCPLSAVAAIDAAVVCDTPLGLAEGIADSVGGVTVTGMRIADGGHSRRQCVC